MLQSERLRVLSSRHRARTTDRQAFLGSVELDADIPTRLGTGIFLHMVEQLLLGWLGKVKPFL
jgi:hypothetical protein